MNENVKLYKQNSESKGEVMSLISMYITNMLGYMIVAFPIYVIVRIVLLKRRKQPVNKLHELFLALFVLYSVGIASQTIIPKWVMGVDGTTGKLFFDVYMQRDWVSTNAVPFKTISGYLQVNEYLNGWDSIAISNLLGNIFLFSPFGFFVPLFWRRMDSFTAIVFMGLAVTCFIEGTQYFIGRSTDIDDIMLNTIGVVIGYGVFLVWKVFAVNEKNVDHS